VSFKWWRETWRWAEKRHLSEKEKMVLMRNWWKKKMGAQTSLGFPGPAINWTAIFEPITVHLRKKRGKQERNGRERGKDEVKEGRGFEGKICLWHSSIWLLLFSADERKSYGFRTTWVMTKFSFFGELSL